MFQKQILNFENIVKILEPSAGSAILSNSVLGILLKQLRAVNVCLGAYYLKSTMKTFSYIFLESILSDFRGLNIYYETFRQRISWCSSRACCAGGACSCCCCSGRPGRSSPRRSASTAASSAPRAPSPRLNTTLR